MLQKRLFNKMETAFNNRYETFNNKSRVEREKCYIERAADNVAYMLNVSFVMDNVL